jgi:hypothetical protein
MLGWVAGVRRTAVSRPALSGPKRRKTLDQSSRCSRCVGELNVSAERFRYKAFISYSHRDSKVAGWLHRALESYRAPKHLIGRENPTGTIQKRLGTLFRDRDELPVAADLTGQINDALAATQFLIVLCSTASAKSKWVNQEVINFKRIKGAASIIAVIVDGEPYASAKPGHEADECFVPALKFQVDAAGNLTDQPAEPIAADLRPGKDGKRMVKLKVLAGLLGVGLDELVQRENLRRQRFMTAVTFASLAGLGIMGALTFNAIEARNEAEVAQERAERQKSQAEGLIEFMLGDLRDKLQPVGRLDVLDSVGEKALGYFATLKPDELSAATLGRKARALHLLGEIQSTSGHLDKAREVFAEANRTTEELLFRETDNPQRIYDHAQSVYWLGNLDWRRGDKISAERAFAEYQRLSVLLVSIEPGNQKWQAEAAYAYTNVGVMLFQDRRFKEASDRFLQGREIQARLASSQNVKASTLIDLARFDAWLADCERSQNNLSAAAKIRVREIGIYEQVLALDPLNKSAVEFYVPSMIALGRLNLDQGAMFPASDILLKAQTLAEKLAKSDPDNSTWQELLARAHIGFGEAQLSLMNTSLSEASADLAGRIAVELLSRDKSILKWKVGLQLSASILKAKSRLLRNDPTSANMIAAIVVSELVSILETQPKRADAILLLGQAELIIGDTSKALNQEARARQHWKRGLQTLETLQFNNSVAEKLTITALLARQGQVAKASMIARELYSYGVKRAEVLSLIKIVDKSVQ